MLLLVKCLTDFLLLIAILYVCVSEMAEEEASGSGRSQRKARKRKYVSANISSKRRRLNASASQASKDINLTKGHSLILCTCVQGKERLCQNDLVVTLSEYAEQWLTQQGLPINVGKDKEQTTTTQQITKDANDTLDTEQSSRVPKSTKDVCESNNSSESQTQTQIQTTNEEKQEDQSKENKQLDAGEENEKRCDKEKDTKTEEKAVGKAVKDAETTRDVQSGKSKEGEGEGNKGVSKSEPLLIDFESKLKQEREEMATLNIVQWVRGPPGLVIIHM